MKECIICRELKAEDEFNDEHVIPDSLNGYYHIKSVCAICNSTLGTKIDAQLSNHLFIKFQKLLHDDKNKKYSNPFRGTYNLEGSDQKVRLELDDNGRFTTRYLPNIPENISSSFSICLDKKDEKKSEEIINKFLERNGIPKDKVEIDKNRIVEESKWVVCPITIDINNFKMGLLKIAYEFAVDQIPDYYHDENAKIISDILCKYKYGDLNKNVTILGDGLSKDILTPFNSILDFSSNNHYLILIGIEGTGLIGIVNIFNIFQIGFLLSKNSTYLDNNIIIGKNDIDNKKFETYTLDELVSFSYSPVEYRFQYWFPDTQSRDEFSRIEQKSEFSFYKENDKVPFFNSQNEIVYSDIEKKLSQEQLEKIPIGDPSQHLITQINLDEELYIKLLPNKKLYKVISVRIEQYKTKNL